VGGPFSPPPILANLSTGGAGRAAARISESAREQGVVVHFAEKRSRSVQLILNPTLKLFCEKGTHPLPRRRSRTLLQYAGNNQWSREEDIYNPDAMLKMLSRWCDAAGVSFPAPEIHG
jgi:hypothetical protein